MIETISFFFGLAFSVLVYYRSIRTIPHSMPRRMAYLCLSTVGITGMVWLSGVLVAHFLRRLGIL